MLSSGVKELISQYADDALELETTRQVADLVTGLAEAEAYFTQLQGLRQATARTLGLLPPENPAQTARLLDELRRRDYAPGWWERLAERWVLAPRFAFAASIVLIILILALFSRYDLQLSRLFNRTEQTVEALQEEARKGLQELTRTAGAGKVDASPGSVSPRPPGADAATEHSSLTKDGDGHGTHIAGTAAGLL